MEILGVHCCQLQLINGGTKHKSCSSHKNLVPQFWLCELGVIMAAMIVGRAPVLPATAPHKDSDKQTVNTSL